MNALTGLIILRQLVRKLTVVMNSSILHFLETLNSSTGGRSQFFRDADFHP